MNLLSLSIGKSAHSCCKTAFRSLTLLTLCLSFTLRPNMSQTCSIGDKSGDLAGQSRVWTLFSQTPVIVLVFRSTCGRTLSCCKIILPCWHKKRFNHGKNDFITISGSMECPCIVMSSVLEFQVPAHTMTLPALYRSPWMTFCWSKRSPFLLHTLTRQSENSTLKRGSSVKTMLPPLNSRPIMILSCPVGRKRRWIRVNRMPLQGL